MNWAATIARENKNFRKFITWFFANYSVFDIIILAPKSIVLTMLSKFEKVTNGCNYWTPLKPILKNHQRKLNPFDLPCIVFDSPSTLTGKSGIPHTALKISQRIK